MSLYDAVATLPLTIDAYSLEGLARMVSSGFERKSTIFVLHGAGEEGRGEDVTYEARTALAAHQDRINYIGRAACRDIVWE
jgi:hypothetical protein